ncbi:MAG: hypothetical protein D6816_19575 [Bacteroidetes bacterium]|nr:MAG: hypothetical protein D6816_19575 [Bacteroidota bacterium]
MQERQDALAAAWLPGTEGQGVANMLLGDGLFGIRPFTGKLPAIRPTWPRSADDLPNVADPLFSFGFGLER